jgi:hypothetical protein
MTRTRLAATQADIDAITRVAREYIESYARGEAERHAGVYHLECLKRRYVTDDATASRSSSHSRRGSWPTMRPPQVRWTTIARRRW